MASNTDKLIGSDGAVYYGEVGATIGAATATGTTSVTTSGFYEVISKSTGTSLFPSGSEAGDFFYISSTDVVQAGDSVKALPTSEAADIKSFTISLSRDKVDVTTLYDRQKTFRMGKADASGSMEGLMTVNSNTFSDRFLDRTGRTSTGGLSVTRIDTDPIYFIGYLNQDTTSGVSSVAIVGKIELETMEVKAVEGEAQNFTAGFAPTSGSRLQKVVVANA